MERTFPNSHVSYDTFNRIFPLVFILAIQVSSELEVLAYGQRRLTEGIPRVLAR